MNEEGYLDVWVAPNSQTAASLSAASTSANTNATQRNTNARELARQHQVTGKKSSSRIRTRQLTMSGENCPANRCQHHMQLNNHQHHHRSATAINSAASTDSDLQSHHFLTSGNKCAIEKQNNGDENIDLRQQRSLLSKSTSSSGSGSGSSGYRNNTGTVMSFSQHQQQQYQRLSGQYSSSQAQLQSLTNDADDSIMRRKTPERGQLFQYRSQLSLTQNQYNNTTNNTSTKSMLTSTLNEPLASSSLATLNSQQLQLIQPKQQVRPLGPKPQTHPPATSAANQNSVSSIVQQPPPYSADASSASTGIHQQQQQQQQHVICHQPPPVQAQHYSSSNSNTDTQQQTPQALQQQQSVNNSGLRSASMLSQFPIQNSSSSQQQVMNFVTNGNQLSDNFSSSPFGQHQFPPVYLTATATSDNTNCHLQQQQPIIVGASKSKSCLTCADISIKWYIIVIALLGLICALIGTIVGAVHSVGRDYISLALLLIGVGLVLIAISWIALRITVKTYRSSSGRRGSSSLHQLQRHQHHQQHLTNQNHPIHRVLHHPSQQFLPPANGAPTISPALRPAQLTRLATTAGGIQRSILNERLYMVAAAAAALSRSAQLGQTQPDSHPPTERGFLSAIKGRLPRRLGRLIPCSSSSGSSSGQHQSELRRPDANQPVLGLENGALAALIHHYQQQAGFPPFLLGPSPPPPHLFPGFAGSDIPFRPPPPSYSASMQDYRLRQLLQERAKQQQQQHQQQQQPSITVHPQPGPSALVTVASTPQASVSSSQSQTNTLSGFTRIQVTSGENQAPKETQHPTSTSRLINSTQASPSSPPSTTQRSVSVTNDIYVPSQQQQFSADVHQSAPSTDADHIQTDQQVTQPNSKVKILAYL